ncbi:TlpA disulfide reductase family protein [candidate division KSB1 bacterium]
MKKNRILISLLLILVSAVYCSGGEIYEIDGVYSFTLQDLDGNPMEFSDLRGKGVMLNVWATWCGPCKEEIPVFVKLYPEYKDRDFELWGVSTDIQGKSVVEPYVNEAGINYPVLLAKEADLKKIFGYIRGYPTTFFFDKDGKLIKRINLPFVDEDNENALEEYFRKEIESILPE